MSQAVAGVLTGAKVAIFLIAILYSYLAYLKMDEFEFGWIGASAAAFLLISLVEFIVILEEQAGLSLFKWMLDLSNRLFFVDSVFLIAGVTSYMFLRSVKSEVEG